LSVLSEIASAGAAEAAGGEADESEGDAAVVGAGVEDEVVTVEVDEGTVTLVDVGGAVLTIGVMVDGLGIDIVCE